MHRSISVSLAGGVAGALAVAFGWMMASPQEKPGASTSILPATFSRSCPRTAIPATVLQTPVRARLRLDARQTALRAASRAS